jgi:hypothetical protein
MQKKPNSFRSSDDSSVHATEWAILFFSASEESPSRDVVTFGSSYSFGNTKTSLGGVPCCLYIYHHYSDGEKDKWVMISWGGFKYSSACE